MADELQHAEIPADEVPPDVTPPVEIPEVPVQAVANQLGDVAMDSAKLVELQVRLFEAECRQSVKQMVQPLALLAGTIALAMASAAVLLVAVGWGLHELTDWPQSVSFLLASVMGAGVAAVMAYSAMGLLKEPRISFAKSKEELMRNVEFLSRSFTGK